MATPLCPEALNVLFAHAVVGEGKGFGGEGRAAGVVLRGQAEVITCSLCNIYLFGFVISLTEA